LSNPLKYSTSTPTGALRHATLGAGVVSAQYDENWNSGATPNTLTTYYLVYEPVNGTAVRVYAPANAAELIKLAKSKGSDETTEAGALTWLSANGYYPANKILENIVTDDLELYIDTRTATSYPRSGTDILDLSGNGKDGTLTNGPTFQEDSESLNFDGVDDYIPFNNLGLSSHTMEGWINSDDNTQGGATYATIVSVLGNYDGGSSKYTYIGFIPNLTFRIDNGVASHANIATYANFPDSWFYVALTYDATSGKAIAYLNGEEIANTFTTTNITFNSVPFNIARTVPGGYFDGSVAKATAYSKALTEAEIKQNYFNGPILTDYITYAFDASNLVSFEPGETSVYSLTGSLGAASDGTLGNGVGFSDIANGNWVFDGVDDKLTLAANINLGNGNVAWTVEAWVKSTTAVNGLGQGSVASNDGSGPVYSMMGINANKMVYWTYQSGWVQYLGNKTINDGNWHHLTWVNYTNYTMDMYVDGVFDRNVGNSTSGNNNPIDTIGNSWSSRFDGDIASVYFYQGKSLSAAEVNQNYQAKIKKYT